MASFPVRVAPWPLLLLLSVFVLLFLSALRSPERFALPLVPSSSALCAWSGLGSGPSSLLPSSTPLVPSPPLPYSSPTGVCLVVRAYAANFVNVPTLLHLLQHNSHPPNVYFVSTDPASSVAELQRVVELGNRETGLSFGHVLNITREQATLDFPEMARGEREYGYAYTDVAVDLLTKHQRYSGQCQWLLLTNADNLYAGNFLDRLQPEMDQGYQLMCWNLISHYDWVRLRGHPQDTREGSSDDGTRRLLNAEWMEGWLDLGGCLWNASLWVEHRLNFIELQRAKKPQWEIADGTFFMHLVHQLNVRRVLIRQALLIHQ